MSDVPDPTARIAQRGTLAVSIGTAVITAQPILLAVALPEFARVFDLSVAQAASLNVVYFAPMLALLIPLGRISDRVHRREMYVLGFLIMAVGAGVVIISGGIVGALFGRVIQGVGAATSICINRAILVTVVPSAGRARAMATMQASSSVGMIAGLLSAGTVVGFLGWQAPFILTLPFALVAAGSARLLLPKLRPADVSGEIKLGMSAIFAGAMLFLGVGLSIPSSGFLTGLEVTLLLTSGMAAIAFFVHRDRRQDSHYLDWDLLSNDFARRLMLGAGAFHGVRSALLVVIPFHMQVGLGLSPFSSSLVLMGIASGEVFFARTSGRMYDSRGPGAAVRLGLVLAGIGLLGIGAMASVAGVFLAAAVMLVIGSGSALFQTSANAALFSVSRRENSGVVSSLLAMCISLGLALGSMSSGLFLDLIEGAAQRFGRTAGHAMVFAASAAYLTLSVSLLLVWTVLRSILSSRQIPEA